MTSYFNLETLKRAPASLPGADSYFPRIQPCFETDSRREKLEQYISGIFHASHGAKILEYLPLLFAMERETGYSAALGLRGAGNGPLFCEAYLDEPVETLVQRIYGVGCPRNQIMELGNLAASAAGDSALLYLVVTRALHLAGIRHLLFAANRAVRISLRRTGFTPVAIGPADPSRLEDGGRRWGSYYQGDPQVMLGDVALAWEQSEANPALWLSLEQYRDLVDDLAEAIRDYNA